MYYGDNIVIKGAWRRHGHGEIHFNDKIIYDGKFVDNIQHGHAKYIHEDGSIWYKIFSILLFNLFILVLF
jgi:hypothetical protein